MDESSPYFWVWASATNLLVTRTSFLIIYFEYV